MVIHHSLQDQVMMPEEAGADARFLVTAVIFLICLEQLHVYY